MQTLHFKSFITHAITLNVSMNIIEHKSQYTEMVSREQPNYNIKIIIYILTPPFVELIGKNIPSHLFSSHQTAHLHHI